VSRFVQAAGARLQWRVIVPSTGRADASGTPAPLAWHMAACREPSVASAHCASGQRLLVAASNPDGHCLTDGVCPRCEADSVEVEKA
jgi:hypothetical protein